MGTDVFAEALGLYDWLKSEGLIGVYKHLTKTSAKGEDCAYAQKVKKLFYEKDENGESPADKFKKRILALAEELK